NSETLWELVSRVPLFSKADPANENPYALLVISQDITELKKTENLSNRQAQQLLTAAEIARDVASSLQAEQVLINATNLIRERFDYYHASVFLVDPTGKYAVLHEASGEIGQKMKAAGHRLAVGSRSLVGQAVARGETVVSNNTRLNPNYYPNPLLPDTRSELVVPLKTANRIIGALDVQSDRINAFQTEDIHTLEILADQLSMALENANLYARSQENLVKHRLLHQMTTAASTSANLSEAIQRTVYNLRTALGEERVAFYLADPDGNLVLHTAIGFEGLEINQFNIQTSQYLPAIAARDRYSVRVGHLMPDESLSTIHPETRSALAVPILFSDELLGVLSLESEQIERFDESDQEIIGALGDSLGAILTNARLVDQIRQQVERQRMLYEITSKIRRSVDIETILRTSVNEISRAVGARKAHIQINPIYQGLPLESEDTPTSIPDQHNNGHHSEDNGK
ncbi:MAG: GAF domain-containing protein, partial [Bellilinea sp.]